MTKDKLEEKHNCDNVNCNHNNTKGLCCLFNPDNCKYRQLQNENAELKWERDTKAELAEHLGKANDKIADLEETINKLREQLALRYDLEDKIKELEETNKANEWHYVKDGKYPTHSNGVLVFTDEGVGLGIYGLDNKKWYTYDTGFDVIAWKEIVLPELKE